MSVATTIKSIFLLTEFSLGAGNTTLAFIKLKLKSRYKKRLQFTLYIDLKVLLEDVVMLFHER